MLGFQVSPPHPGGWRPFGPAPAAGRSAAAAPAPPAPPSSPASPLVRGGGLAPRVTAPGGGDSAARFFSQLAVALELPPRGCTALAEEWLGGDASRGAPAPARAKASEPAAPVETLLDEVRASCLELQAQLDEAARRGEAAAAALGEAERVRASAGAGLLPAGGAEAEASERGARTVPMLALSAAPAADEATRSPRSPRGGGGGVEDPAIQAEWWVTAVTGRARPAEESLQQWLRSGVVLCELANTLAAGACPRVSESAMPFKQMENVEAYVRACTAYGVPAQDIFVTVDLFEGKNMPAVVRNLHSLGRVAQARGFPGPTLGAKLATTNKRSFTAEQMAEARAAPARWTNRGSAAGDAEWAAGPRVRSSSGSGFRDIVGPRENPAASGAFEGLQLAPSRARGALGGRADAPADGAPAADGDGEAEEEASSPEERAERARARVAERVERARQARQSAREESHAVKTLRQERDEWQQRCVLAEAALSVLRGERDAAEYTAERGSQTDADVACVSAALLGGLRDGAAAREATAAALDDARRDGAAARAELAAARAEAAEARARADERAAGAAEPAAAERAAAESAAAAAAAAAERAAAVEAARAEAQAAARAESAAAVRQARAERDEAVEAARAARAAAATQARDAVAAVEAATAAAKQAAADRAAAEEATRAAARDRLARAAAAPAAAPAASANGGHAPAAARPTVPRPTMPRPVKRAVTLPPASPAAAAGARGGGESGDGAQPSPALRANGAAPASGTPVRRALSLNTPRSPRSPAGSPRAATMEAHEWPKLSAPWRVPEELRDSPPRKLRGQ